jgi:type I restriction enzyme S subunit
MGSGATFAEISKSTVEVFEIPLPPLQEQKRIAAMLNEQMAAVERARAGAEAQLEAAKALPAAYLRAVFSSPEAQQWPTRMLGEVLTLRKDIVHPRDSPSGPATFVGLEHVDSTTGKRIGSLPVEMSRLTGRKPRFYQGDIVYGYLRPYLNKVWVGEFDGLCSVDQYVYSVSTAVADTEYVAWFMRSDTFLRRAPVGGAPAWLPRIRTEEVVATKVNLPPLEEQRRVAAMLNGQMRSAEQVREAIEEELESVNKLPAALLRRAFNGEL